MRNYQIGEFSTISRISVKALRHYQEIGLLLPSYIDEDTAYRYYSEALLERAGQIQNLRSLEFSLKEISEIFEDMNDDDDLFEVIKQKSDSIKNKIVNLQNIQNQLKLILATSESINMNKPTEIRRVNIPDQTIASIRFKGLYSDLGKYFKKVFKAAGFQTQGKPGTIYFDEGYKETDADMECFVPVKKDITGEEVNSRLLKGGKGYSLNHVGSYEDIQRSYKKMIDYLNENDLPFCAPCREIYHKGPGMIFKGNPEKYITEILFLES